MKKILPFLLLQLLVGLLPAQVSFLKEINPSPTAGSLVARQTPFVHGNLMYFLADDGTNGAEIWRTDATTAGTSLLKNIVPGNEGIKSVHYSALGSDVILAVASASGFAIWKTDGTPDGTTLVKNIYTGSDAEDWAGRIAGADGFVCFAANDGVNGPELWRTDGTAAGTKMIKNISPFASSFPQFLTAWNGKILFYHDNSTNGYELWVSDGTEGGTALVKDINPGANSSNSFPAEFNLVATPLGVFFNPNDGVNGRELWISDGTPAGTRLVKNINPANDTPGAFLSGNPAEYQETAFFKDKFYFNGFDDANGKELWATDGTTAGTALVKDAAPGAAWMTLYRTVTTADRLFFIGETFIDDFQLYVTDGTAAGTQQLKYIDAPGFYDGPDVTSPMVSYVNRAWFAGRTFGFGSELWKSDGTTAGSAMAADINFGPADGSPKHPTVLGDRIIFYAISPNSGHELYSYIDPAVSTQAPDATAAQLTVSPNPAGQQFSVETNLPFDGPARVQLISTSGYLSGHWEMTAPKQSFPCEHIPAGLYLLRIINSSGVNLNSKIIIH